MTREAIIANVKKNYAGADEATIDAVLRTLQETKLDWRLPEQSSVSVSPSPVFDSDFKRPEFVGEHLTLEQYRKLSLKERGAHQRHLKEQNRAWLGKTFFSLQAAWLMVLDGKIIASGDSLKDYPSTEQIRAIGLRHGKRPFVFINDLLVAIEEGWHHTVYRDDFYPTVPLVLHNVSDSLEVVADFDTGAASSFADYDLLLSHAIITSEEDEQAEGSQHLSQEFEYVSKTVIVEVKLDSGKILRHNLPILCVPDWKASPFIQVNPHRTALAGRDLFLELQPSILLDFANRRTKLVAPELA